ncbi:cell division protein ZapE [Nocardia sp. CDC186]|uniref:Cell division protein ZapE n=1 Tax=Nocardia implantans TaxID=3108168 RepID=A0ABU6B2X6_9NOCA|nr:MULTISPECIES: cell division protein ZapE [unclassified Nocardia]MBF6190389.1 cell division protein ZapE [Nocardia beijingensis]MEA3531917.1 cell division protein ZapE [Nocardia sp. CDC192]MEB3514081.1 cell division protein ZapE [Nocardia sp. CDC186]
MEIRWDADQARAAARLRELVDRRGRPVRRHRGVYLHGRPGRGKTMLMNRFFAEVASRRKRRYHFHQFFANLHAAAHASGSIDAAVDALLGDAILVCFDEFHVHDIGDAMLIARLLDALFARRVTLVVTSNYPPAELLPNPLFHDRFVPAIERILADMDVVAVDGATDYRAINNHRAATGFASGRYVVAPPCHTAASVPWASAAQNKAATQRETEPIVEISEGARSLRVIAADGGTLVIDFAVLCGTPTSAADYVALAQRFPCWEIRDVPPLRSVPPDWVMRFVNAVDVLSDADRALTVIASSTLGELVRDVREVPDMSRLTSRLCALSQSPPDIAR